MTENNSTQDYEHDKKQSSKPPTQWHVALMSAMKLQLKDRGELEYTPEMVLNSQAIRADLLIVNKKPGIVLTDDIGRFFKAHNILEFKSADAKLGPYEYAKTVGYAALYADGHIDRRDYGIEDITVTMIRARKPAKLIKWLEDRGRKIGRDEAVPGVYVVRHELFATQIVVTDELNNPGDLWIEALTNNLDASKAREMLRLISGGDPEERKLMEPVLEVAISGNRQVFSAISKEGDSMYPNIMRFIYPDYDSDIDKAEKRGKAEGMAKGKAEGKAEGIAKGKAEGMAKICAMLVNSGKMTREEADQAIAALSESASPILA